VIITSIRHFLLKVIFLAFVCLADNTSAATTRTYFVAAEETLWDYAPSYPINPMHQGEFSEHKKVFVEGDDKTRIGHKYYKARFIEYKGNSFTAIKPRGFEWEHLVSLGQSFEPMLVIPSGNETMDNNTDLAGPIIISRKDTLLPNGKLKGIDREFVVLFTIFDENKSYYLDKNINAFAPESKDKKSDESFKESNLMHSMNGYVYDNVPGLNMKVGDNIRWYQLALGTEADLHTPHWGNTLLSAGQRINVLSLLPASHVTVEMQPDNPGIWMYHCYVNDDIEAGMMGRYTVLPANSKKAHTINTK
jgi:Multicopper oxidase